MAVARRPRRPCPASSSARRSSASTSNACADWRSPRRSPWCWSRSSIAVSPALHDFSIRTVGAQLGSGGEAIIRIDTLSAVLLPFAAGLWLLTVAVTPRAALDRRGLRRTALATLITLASFLTESAVVLLLLSVASVWTFLSALADPAHRYQRRVVAVYLGVSTLFFAVGVALLVGPGVQNTALETAGMWLIVIAALVRKGIVPFHAWVPEVFDHGGSGRPFCSTRRRWART